MKVCTKCKIEKPLDEFNKYNGRKDNLRSDCKQCWKEYYLNNKEKIDSKNKEYRQNNKEKETERKKIYRQNNKEKINRFKKLKKQNNYFFKLKCNIGVLILNSFKKKSYTKKSRTYQILGCSFEDFKLHLESKFESWMSWDNHGKYNGQLNFGWDIDHIIPLSSAKTEEELIKLNHYTNLQPLCSKVNRDIKKDKF